MGSCSGKPLHDDGAVMSGSPHPGKTQNAYNSKGHDGQSKTGSVPKPHAGSPKGKVGNFEVSDSEEFESTGTPEKQRTVKADGPGSQSTGLISEEYGMLKGGDDDENVRAPKRKLRVGYSSGGSSGTLDGDDHRASSTSHLLELKHSLSAGGDLCKGVVRIEVRHTVPVLHRSFANDQCNGISHVVCLCFSRQILVGQSRKYMKGSMMETWWVLASRVLSEE